MSEAETIAEGAHTYIDNGAGIRPFEYRGYKQEVVSAKHTAHLGTALHRISPIYDVSGPDAIEFLRSVCINSFRNFEVGQIRHAVLCNDDGKILTDGVVARIGDDVYRTYWLAPVLEYRLLQSGLRASGVDRSDEEFFLQLGGLRTLEILEAASGDDLHDIRFGRHRMTTIAGRPVQVMRLGMAATLAYELHGAMEDTEAVYRAIWEAGQPFGLVKQGRVSYVMQHTEAGFPNINIHYPLPWYEDAELGAFMDTRPRFAYYNKRRELVGSLGDEVEARFVSPIQVGWTKMIDFGHDFIGKEALQREAAEARSAIVTLVWNDEDIADVYASQFRGRDVEPFDAIDDRPVDLYFDSYSRTGFTYHADWVLADGERIGTSVGRINSVYYRRMISLGLIDAAHASEGTELTVLWGRPGTPQKQVRATVGRYPYFDLPSNSEIDVATIPRLGTGG